MEKVAAVPPIKNEVGERSCGCPLLKTLKGGGWSMKGRLRDKAQPYGMAKKCM